MQNDRAHTQVTVYGKLIESTSEAKPEHHIFHYHVNILKQGQSSPQDYDREIHLCHTNQNQTPQDKELNLPLIISNDKPSQTPLVPPIDKVSVTENKDESDRLWIPEQAIDKPVTEILRRIRCKLNLTSIKQVLIKTGNNLIAIPRQIYRQFLNLINHLSITSPKHLPRNIFTHSQQKHIRKAGLVSVLVLALVLTIYFTFYPAQFHTPTSHPSTSINPTKVITAKQDYHAVITQNTNGVTITIEGPEHAEVLTSLPPGYHPVVVDNKIVHIVTAGNTLWFIAKRYIKNPYRYPELVRLNKIKNPDLIYPGDRVIIQYIRKP